jgi:hypothetical protein
VRIIESSVPFWVDAQAWRVDPEPVLELGADPEIAGQQFFGVGEIVRLTDGRIVVANEGLVEVQEFEPDGQYLGMIGARGEGPGEFQRVDAVYRCPDDTIVVNTFSGVSYFESDGAFAHSESLVRTPGDGAPPRIAGVSSDCSRFLMRTGRVAPGLGDAGPVSYLYFLGTPDNSVRDTLTRAVSYEAIGALIDGAVQTLPKPWGAVAKWAVGRERAFLALGDRFEVKAFDLHGELREIIRWPGQLEPVTHEDRARYAEKRARWLERFPGSGEAMPPLEDYLAVADRKPTLLGLLVDDEGNLWVRGYPPSVAGQPSLFDLNDPRAPFRDNPLPTAEPERWTVLDSSGRLLGTVAFPADLAVRGISGGYVIGVWRDVYDVERVRLHRLIKDIG